ncbi:ATP-binding protein [Microbacterium oxydans]|uniref:ATP-binding protein n=1 Tax=Microbacterium oxydans TaxID=82380 RepID=UPI0022B0D4C0|nr:ATP-binding protein [Microbacterium oxydans]
MRNAEVGESRAALIAGYSPAITPTTSTSAGPDGTGLGLAIVQSIAKTHSGDVRLRARTGGGMIASIVLPL